jgi:hypothetical protein
MFVIYDLNLVFINKYAYYMPNIWVLCETWKNLPTSYASNVSIT